ncbi:DUF4139 domain-containing protein, partial [Desulfovibrio sp.]|uniref:DUF4139 domain-containing protein n=1 Tax=Desulfovibrio sp. TaxID=885 RepID=UPI0023D17198
GAAWSAAPAHTHDGGAVSPASPATALISPVGGRLVVEERLAPLASGPEAGRTLVFALPPDAVNLQLSVPGQTVVRWSTTPVPLAESAALARAREDLAAERLRLNGRLIAVKAALAFWQSPENAGAQDAARRASLIAESVPELAQEQETLEARIKLLGQRIERLPAPAGLGELVHVILQKAVPAGEKVVVRYSYTWRHCGWNAVYDFNARPEEGSGGVIDVRLMADVWQYSGIDWKGTKVTLATRGSGPREPAPLPEWVVDSQPRPQPRPVPLALNAARSAKVAAEGAADAAPANAGVAADSSSVYASWTLAEPGLPEGRSRLVITSDAWQAPLQWLARPTRGDSRVWLLAKYDLAGDTAWPEGTAEYSVDGQSVGSGMFRPRGGVATLYFGADPRVNVRTFDDTRTKGESGFIKTSKTWTWAWTYTVSNEHARPVTVKLERPAPVIVDEGVTVTYKDEPPAQKNEQEHMFFWNVEVPGHGKASVKHSVTISSPEKLQLIPDVP